MSSLKKYADVFVETFEIEQEKLVGLQYQGTELWDSVGHMNLIANLEEAFEISGD